MKFPNNKFIRMTVPVPLAVLVVTVILVVLGFVLLYKFNEKEKQLAVAAAVEEVDHVSIRLVMEDKYKHIRPLAFVEFNKEDSLLMSIKAIVIDYIQQQKIAGNITTASAYIRNLNRQQDARVNPSELYLPGSLMKIPVMMAYLKQADRDRSFLDKEYTFSTKYDLPAQTITTNSIVFGKSYKVRELLYYTIVHSDNQALAVLNENLDFNQVIRIFSDLQMPVPGMNAVEYAISLKDYSRLFRVLFNATYLSREMSEYALELLSQTQFKDGMTKYLDASVTVAHKFGERNLDGIQQLHEVGIVYLSDKYYLLGVMTKGNDIDKQKEVISQISKLVYDSMKSEAAE